MAAVAGYGAAVLHGVPAEPGSVLAVAATLGHVRETNYGRLFDVRVEPSPDNLAFTSREILPHTDNPYRDPVPTIQLLHCLRDAARGGDTLLIDGFAAAALLREEDPAAFAVLTATPWPFAYADAGTELRACASLIGTDPRGRIREVRFNGRSMQPLRGPAGQVAAAYDAYLAWPAAAASGACHRHPAGARRLPHLRQHPHPARPHRVHRPAGRGHHGRRGWRAAPAGLLRRPGRPGQHPGGAAPRPQLKQARLRRRP